MLVARRADKLEELMLARCQKEADERALLASQRHQVDETVRQRATAASMVEAANLAGAELAAAVAASNAETALFDDSTASLE